MPTITAVYFQFYFNFAVVLLIFGMSLFIVINPADNVAVALKSLHEGCKLQAGEAQITLCSPIEAGHKFALKNIAKGENIVKYGFPVGHALMDIRQGEHVHTHNVGTNLDENSEYDYRPVRRNIVKPQNTAVMNAYLRYNGEAGIRNELWIVPTVGCINGQAQAIVSRLKQEVDCSHIDDIRVYTHNYGCSQLGDDHRNTRRALAATARHPNAGGVLVMGLGCENNQIEDLKREMGEWDESRVRFLVAQKVDDEVEEGIRLMKELVDRMREDRRRPLPLSLLKVGLKCGGSDGLSGITANPLVGRFSDWLISQGGTTVLTEVPEMFGAETILMNRAVDRRVFDDTVALINSFKDYFRRAGQPVYENPSPGNKAGGITTLEDKSLGCTQKGGTADVVDVLQYASPLSRQGLNLLNAPGNDLVASTALALSGCQIILFTTGRGTPFGTFVPTMKIASNTPLFNFKRNWIDFNAGSIAEDESIDDALKRLVEFTLETVNGRLLKHEIAGFREIAIFKSGVTL
jgi:altronate hydrolase